MRAEDSGFGDRPIDTAYSISQGQLMVHVVDEVVKKIWLWHPDWDRVTSRVEEQLHRALDERNRKCLVLPQPDGVSGV
jgi:hypothetical protein